MRFRLVYLSLVILLLIGKLPVKADDDKDDDKDDADHEDKDDDDNSVHHLVLPPITITDSTTATSEITITTSQSKIQPSTTAECSQSTDIECGKVFNAPRRLIVGGNNAEPFEWPWMVTLLNSGHVVCGGVLLTERHVLTAAHCFLWRGSQDVVVVLGEYNVNRTEGYEEKFNVSVLQKHKDFAPKYGVNNTISHYRNDLALLTLDKSAKFNAAIRPVCLPSPGVQDFTGLNATAIGWGVNDTFKNSWAHILQEVELPILSHEDCDAIHAYYTAISIKAEKEICAARLVGGRDTCVGDSGGPLLIQENNHWTVIGLVSWGPDLCGSGLPGVYTRVDRFLKWIRETINQECIYI